MLKNMKEIRWHGRGGQGAKTAALLLGEAAINAGKFVQAFPEYGPERMGAPIQAFTRISTEPIHIRSSVTNPNIVVVLDPTLLNTVDVTAGMQTDGILIVNTDDEPAEIRKMLKLKGLKIYTVNATRIAQETIGRPIPNTPMMGALVRATGMMPIENLADYVRSSFGKKFAAEIIEGNVKAVERAYAEVKAE